MGRFGPIIYPILINPDEAQAAANALRFKNYGLSWNALDGYSQGPYNTLIISWPYLLGGDVTLNTVRLTAFLLLGSIFALVYSSIKSVSGRFYAVLLSTPLALFYGLTKSDNFLHYSSELFPLFLLVLANFITVLIYRNPKKNEPNIALIIFLGLAIGAAPFSKLQSSPIAVIIGIMAIYSLFRLPTQRKKVLVSIFMFSCLVPGLALLIPLLLTNKLDDFFTSYLVWASLYVKESLSFIDLLNLMVSADPLLKDFTDFFVSLGLLMALFFLIRNDKSINILTIYSFTTLLASFCVIARPGNLFPHYLMFFPPFAILCIGYSVSYNHFKKFYLLFLIPIIFFIRPVTDLFKITAPLDFHNSGYTTELKDDFLWKSPNVYLWLSKPTDRLLIWGWMPQWYVSSGLAPATRETITYSQIVPTKLRDYYRKRMLDDLNASSPNIIIDSVSGDGFHYRYDNDPKINGLFSFPELAALVSNEFEKLGDIHQHNPGCPNIYIRKQRMIELRQHNINFKSILASVRYPSETNLFSELNLNDNSVTEDSCVDYWLTPDGQVGDLLITFNDSEPVKKLLMLNTANGKDLNRATKKLRFSLYNKEHNVFTGELELNHHPKWTEYVFDRPYLADSIKIQIISFEGFGAGLNEVKVIK